MRQMTDIEDKLASDLSKLATSATPKIRSFAAWLIDNLPLVAFNSIRGLAQTAGVNPNTVTRLSHELGFEGFDAFRSAVQARLHGDPQSYGNRARALQNRAGADVFSEVIAASRENAERIFSDDGVALLESCVQPLLDARRVYTLGVRSCYSIAHYFSYVGSMAFDNFVEVPTMPGAILDQLSEAGPDDIVVAISYQHYAAEVARGCQIARENGARILALTDAYTAPIATGAWKTLCLPMAGPQLMPSLNTAFIAMEMLLTAMTARSPEAANRIARFESRIQTYGGYLDQRIVG